jgi:aarF domain-containing kinase
LYTTTPLTFPHYHHQIKNQLRSTLVRQTLLLDISFPPYKTNDSARRNATNNMHFQTKGNAIACLLLLCGSFPQSQNNYSTDAFVLPGRPNRRAGAATSMRPGRSGLAASTVSDASAMMREVREKMNENEDARMVMDALRGRGMNEDERAVDGLQMRLVDIDESSSFDSLPYTYNPGALQEFFRRRPLSVLKRIVQLASVGGGLAAKVGLDVALGRLEKNPDLEVQRAAELRDIITSLGPFYIKIGQALSIRPDILSPRSMVELQKLCDKVPSYDSNVAFATIERELGRPVEELFSEITPEPVAAASLGQVYKAKLRTTGETVAVKVQRPAVLETVSLDLYLVREFGLLARNFPALTSRLDAVDLLDEFAFRFYQELDYNLECDNGIRIAEDMKVLPMVVIPKNYPEYTSRRVHVAEWIEGEKLSQSKADDVGALVNLGVITYLTQLLDKGFFHAGEGLLGAPFQHAPTVN